MAVASYKLLAVSTDEWLRQRAFHVVCNEQKLCLGTLFCVCSKAYLLNRASQDLKRIQENSPGLTDMSGLEDRISRLEGEVSKLSDRVSRLEERVIKLEERVARVEEAVNALRERVARVEGIVEQMDKRLNHIETELREFRREVNERLESLRKEIFGEISSLRRELSTRFYWLIGILITMWITIILTILFKAH